MIGLLQLGRDVWSAEGFHHALQWIHKVIHEVFDSAGAAAQMPLQALAHHAPAKPRSIADGGVRVLDAQHALLDEVEHLPIERRLQAVGHVPGKLLPQMNRLLADRRIERHRLLDRFRRCLGAAHHFHQRNDVRRVERMADEDALGVLALRLHHARRDARRARGDDRVRRRGVVHVGEELDLEVRAARGRFPGRSRPATAPAFMSVVKVRRSRDAPGERPMASSCLPGLVDVLAQVGFRVRRRIGRDDVEAARQILGRPTRADDSGADDGDAVNWFVRMT